MCFHYQYGLSDIIDNKIMYNKIYQIKQIKNLLNTLQVLLSYVIYATNSTIETAYLFTNEISN